MSGDHLNDALLCQMSGMPSMQCERSLHPLQVEELAAELERLNPNKNALASPLINAKWRLLYTTSASILGTSKPPFLRPIGPIYQTIDAVNLTAKNEESWPFFNQVCRADCPRLQVSDEVHSIKGLPSAGPALSTSAALSIQQWIVEFCRS